MKLRWLGLALLLSCSCDLVAKVPKIDLPALPKVDVQLPKVDGQFVLMELNNARLELDPTLRDPITALGDCSDSVTYCYSPGVHELDECVRSVRTCVTSQPWFEPTACCPQKCQDDYAALRAKGVDAPGALDKVFYVDHSCFPGVDNALAGK